MVTPEIDRAGIEFAGAKGLVIFGGALVLSYVRDGNTLSYPHYRDLVGGGCETGETPFETFQREVQEEFSLSIARTEVSFAMSYPSMLNPSIPGYFIVADKPVAAINDIHFGDEGESYQISTMANLLADERFIPFLRDKVDLYLYRSGLHYPDHEAAA